MIALDAGEAKLFSKYWGRENLVEDEEFWGDVYAYYSQDSRDAPLPLMFNPYTVRMVLEMLECPPGVCSRCCYYGNIQVNPNDIRRIVEHTSYTEQDLEKLVAVRDGKVALSGQPDGCPFLKDDKCTIHGFRPDACYMFPFSATEALLKGEKVKQMQIRIICEPAMAVARKLITESMSKGKSLLLPDLTLIPKVK